MQPGGLILVPIDFSNDSKLALKMADYQAHKWRAGLVLLYVERDLVNVPVKTSSLIEYLRYIKYLTGERVTCFHCIGDPIDAIIRVAEHYKPRAIFMGYGEKGEYPGPVAGGVKLKLPAIVELFSETMAGLLPSAA